MLTLIKNLLFFALFDIVGEKMKGTRRRGENEQPKSVGAVLWDECEKILNRVFDQRHLPADFPRSLLMELYAARTILFAAFTLGIRLGGLSGIYFPIREVLGNIIILLLTYGFLPLVGLNIAALLKNQKITLNEYRVLMISWAFLCGVFSMIANIHYSLADYGPPNYFMPVLVGLTAHLVGKRFDKDRKSLVGVSVGSAVAASLIMLIITGGLSFGSLFSLFLCSVNAIIALQFMIYDLIQDGVNASSAMTHVIGVIFIMLNFFILLHLTGNYVTDPDTNDVASANPFHTALSA